MNVGKILDGNFNFIIVYVIKFTEFNFIKRTSNLFILMLYIKFFNN